MLSKQLIAFGAIINFAIGLSEASTSHVHLRIHSSTYEAQCDGPYDSPMSVEGVEGIFCVTGPACVADYAKGACPCADSAHGLPYGSYCGIVETGVYGCKPCKENEPCNDVDYLYLEDKYNEEDPLDCTYTKQPVSTDYKDWYTPEPQDYNDVTPSPTSPVDNYGSTSGVSNSCEWSDNGYPTITYTFNGDDTANIKGTVVVEYLETTHAKIKTSLDFSRVQTSDLLGADGNCTEFATEYKWHIHVKWSSKNPYGSLEQCSGAATGGHYDPTKACGPASEYAGTDECLAKVASYSCTPDSYSKNPANCEQGDLSGKFGALKLNGGSRADYEYEDYNFPSFEDYSPYWNILFHPSCANKAAPRFACAQGMLANDPASYGC